jgi:hypothetical protein
MCNVDSRAPTVQYRTLAVEPLTTRPQPPNHRLRTTLSVVGLKVTRLLVRRLVPNVTVRLRMPYFRFFDRGVFGRLPADFFEFRRDSAGS